MGLLLSVLITCVGVLEVIACYTQFRVGTAYNECKSNIRDIAKYYAVELRKHELHFEPGPDDGGPSTSQETLSELIRKRTVRTQYSNGHAQITSSSCSETPGQGTPNLAANLKVPRNSVCGLDSPTVQNLISPEIDITEAIVEKMQSLESNEWIRKSPSPYPEKSGLEVVEKDFWRSRSPSPFPESKDSDSGVELIYTPGLKHKRDVSPLLETPDIPEIVDTDTMDETDLEVENIMKSDIPRQASPYPETLFGITADSAETEDTKFDEAFLRSLDGVNKSSKCDDRRRSFKKKRNSSSTSSRASRDEISRSLTSLDEIDLIDKKPEVETKKISPLTEEDTEIITEELNGHRIRSETVISEKCESIASPTPGQFVDKNKKEATVTKQEPTLFEAKIDPNISQDSSNPDKSKANVSFTEKVKDLEISVQLLVTVKGTSQGDKMEYTTTVTQDDQKPKSQKAVDHSSDVKEETITKTSEDKSEFGNVKTSVTYGSSISTPEEKPNLKDLQISSQSLIHAERTVQDDVASSEAEFLKLYETFTELPDKEKDKFLQKIGQSTKSFEEHIENTTNSNTEINLENPPEEHIDSQAEKPTVPKQPTEEKIMITEITEITESTESVLTIPPEKLTSQNVIQTDDANLSEISTTDNKIDKTDQMISSTKEFNQSVIENENKQDEIIESNVTQKHVNNLENIPDGLQIVVEPSKIENANVSLQIITHNLGQTNDVNINKPSAQTAEKIINDETKIITSMEQQTNVIVDNETITNNNQNSNVMIEETKTVVIPEKQVIQETNQVIIKSEIPEEKIIATNEKQEAIPKTIIMQETITSSTTENSTKSEKPKIEANLEVPKGESSSDSSSTPSTVVINPLRRASQTAFEDATPVQHQEMMKRRVSASEISPKQASQAFWEPDPSDPPAQVGHAQKTKEHNPDIQ